MMYSPKEATPEVVKDRKGKVEPTVAELQRNLGAKRKAFRKIHTSNGLQIGNLHKRDGTGPTTGLF